MSSLKKLVIIGGSTAFWEINEIIEDINAISPTYQIIAVLDDSDSLIGKVYGNITVEGPLEKALDFDPNVRFIFAIGSFKTRIIREAILRRLNIPEEKFETLIHPTAKIFSKARIGFGCIIHYGTIVFNESVVESFSIIAANCVIAVSNLLGKGCLLGSNVTTTTGVRIGSFAFIGSSTSIAENIEVGPGAQIGMGSLVLKDIPPGVFVLGSPPRMLDKVEISEEIINYWKQRKRYYGYS